MSRVLLQPRGQREARGPQNFELSIRRGLPLAAYRQWMTSTEEAALHAIYGDAPLRLWGSTPAASPGNLKGQALQERGVGDLVLFYADKSFIARATVAHLTHNPVLAGQIWGADEEGRTWEHMMAVTDVDYISVPSARILVPLGMDEVVRGLTLLSPMASTRVRASLGLTEPESPSHPTQPPAPSNVDEAAELLRSMIGLPLETVAQNRVNRILAVGPTTVVIATDASPEGRDVSLVDVQAALNKLSADGIVHVTTDDLGYRSAFISAFLAALPGTSALTNPARVVLTDGPGDDAESSPTFAVLDGPAEVRVRKEQAALRRLLVGSRKVAECALCRRDFPVEFLIAAHIKRRSVCADEEKRDLKNIAMLACTLGCDRLYEDGYVSVVPDGRIVAVAESADMTTAIKQYRSRLDGEECGAHKADNAAYFAWHFANVFRGN